MDSLTDEKEYRAMLQQLNELEALMDRTPNIELHEKIEALKSDLNSCNRSKSQLDS